MSKREERAALCDALELHMGWAMCPRVQVVAQDGTLHYADRWPEVGEHVVMFGYVNDPRVVTDRKFELPMDDGPRVHIRTRCVEPIVADEQWRATK